MGVVAPSSQEQLTHVARAAMQGIHDVFSPAKKEDDDPNSVKKLRNQDSAWALSKDMLGFDFDGKARSILLDSAKRDKLISTLKEWTRLALKKKSSGAVRVTWKDFCKVICQLRHAAISLPAAQGFMSECNKFASHEQTWVFIRHGTILYQELHGWRTVC